MCPVRSVTYISGRSQRFQTNYSRCFPEFVIGKQMGSEPGSATFLASCVTIDVASSSLQERWLGRSGQPGRAEFLLELGLIAEDRIDHDEAAAPEPQLLQKHEIAISMDGKGA
jgi:hypothetical protein